MHSRRDQVEAHAFVTSRLRSALVRAEPDAVRPPLRRTPLALVLGAMLGVIAIAGVVVLSLLKPGASRAAWQQPGALIVERETGNRYVLSAGRLRPVLNYASARLLLGERLKVVSVSARSLGTVPRGGQVGIVGAPDMLPPPSGAGDQPWLVCANPPQDADGAIEPGVTVLMGAAVRALSQLRAEAALVSTQDGAVYLVEGGRRMRLTAPWVARALGIDGSHPLPVRSSWLGALPAGPDLGTLPITGRGQAGPALDGTQTRVGQVLRVSGPGTPERHYLVTPEGLMPASGIAAALALGDPATAAAYDRAGARVLALSPTALASAPVVDAPQWASDLPPIPPALATDRGEGSPCALVGTAGRTTKTAVVAVPAAVLAAADPVDAAGMQRDSRTADRVAVTPGGGMLTRTLAAPGVPGEGLYLVVDSGAKYPVDGDAAAKALGYAPDRAAAVPADLLALLPTGPVLHLLGGGGA
jgi:type VII secretion protein EccB